MVPSGWTETKLDDVCVFERGLTYSKQDERDFSNNVVLRANNIDLVSHSLNFDELKFIDDAINIPMEKKIAANTILMCISSGSKSHLGKVAFIDRDYGYAFGGFMGLIKPKVNILPKYLYYTLVGPEFKKLISQLTDGTNINNLKYSDIQQFLFLLPTKEEQQRIVEKLDTLFADIEKEKQVVQQNLQNAKELFESEKKSLMQKVQHYENVHLVDLYNFIDYRGVTPNKIDTGVPLVTAKNVKMGYIDYTIKDFISEEDYLARQSRGISKKGDILFTTEAPLGNVAIADLDKFSAGQRIITLQQYSDGKLELSNDFYCYYMQSDYFQTIIHSLASGATAQGIKAAKLKLVLVPLVPYQIQKEIVEKLDALYEQTQKLEQIYTQQIADLDELKQAILKKAFNGEL